MSQPVKLNDVLEAMELSGEEVDHYLDKRTGEIITMSAEEFEAADKVSDADNSLSQYPEWQRDSITKAREILSSEDQFLLLPVQDSRDDYRLMQDFSNELPSRNAAEQLNRAMQGRGAFSRFRTTAQSLGLEDQWYEFKRKRLEQIAIDWVEENNIPYTRDDASDAADARM